MKDIFTLIGVVCFLKGVFDLGKACGEKAMLDQMMEKSGQVAAEANAT